MLRVRLVASALLAASVGARAPAAAEPAAPPDALRLLVAGDALVRVSRDAVLRAAPAWRGRALVATRGGREVPHAPARAGDAVAFVATDEGGRDGLYEIRPAASAPSPSADVVLSGATTDRFERRDDLVHGAVAAAEPEVYDRDVPAWYLHGLAPRGSVDVALALPAPAAAGPGVLRVTVVGTHAGPVRLAARVGNDDLGVAEIPFAPRPATATFALPRVPSGETTVRVSDRTGAIPDAPRNDASDGRGTVWVDSVAVDVPRTAYDGPRLRLRDGAHRPLASFAGDAHLVPHRDPPDPVAAARGAEMAIVSTAALLPGARRLAAHRSSRGVRAVAVPASHVWDRLGGGEASPEALARFLRSLPGLRFALLCGDATHDRADLVPEETIPTALARTKYNGATASDRLLVVADARRPLGGPAIGRLPFRDPKDLDAFVDRVVRYETSPPAHATRRLARFVASEGRFGAAADAAIELLFRSLVATAIPPSYDVEVTFANPRSPYGWPPAAFSEKVVSDLNEGSLFHTYVGHGFARGFDHLWAGGKRFPILQAADAAQAGTTDGCPPALFVVACTTAIFDVPALEGIGEILLRRPRGPVAYWGATRVCHPVWNSIVGRSLAMRMFRDPERRLGETIRVACDEAVAPTELDVERLFVEAPARVLAPGEDFARLYREGALMYALLGDPALEVAYPREDLRVAVADADGGCEVVVAGDGLVDGAAVHVSLEVSRALSLAEPEPAGDGLSPEAAAAMRRNHARANDKAVARATAVAARGEARATLAVEDRHRGAPLFAKAWTAAGGDVRQGVLRVTLPERPVRAGGAPLPPPR